MSNYKKLTMVRAAFLFVAALFLALGILRGEHSEVLKKAIRICLECIGIG